MLDDDLAIALYRRLVDAKRRDQFVTPAEIAIILQALRLYLTTRRVLDTPHADPLDVLPRQTRDRPGPDAPPLRLSDLRQPTVTIACPPCARRGVYNVERLIRQHGNLRLPDVLTVVATGCPQMRESTPRCQAVYDHLIAR